MLGFLVRRCAREIDHNPTPKEFAEWANNRKDNGHAYNLFGKAITPHAAEVMLRKLGRLVTVRSESDARKSNR